VITTFPAQRAERRPNVLPQLITKDIVSGERDQDPAISSDDHRGISLVVGLLAVASASLAF
jgi:hypothetical protein